jgi:hypothetical protein
MHVIKDKRVSRRNYTKDNLTKRPTGARCFVPQEKYLTRSKRQTWALINATFRACTVVFNVGALKVF